MRFHHSTRRRRPHGGFAGHHSPRLNPTSHHLANRWTQLSYCRQTNIYFNRRCPIEPAAGLQQPDAEEEEKQAEQELEEAEKQSAGHFKHNHRAARDCLKQDMAIEGKLGQLRLGEREDRSSCRLDMEAARQKLVAQVEKHPFWSNKAAKKMRLTGIKERKIYIYELTSHCERRDLEWRYEPYRGGLVAGSTPFRRAHPQAAAAANSTPFVFADASRQVVPPSPLSHGLAAVAPNSTTTSPTGSYGSPVRHASGAAPSTPTGAAGRLFRFERATSSDTFNAAGSLVSSSAGSGGRESNTLLDVHPAAAPRTGATSDSSGASSMLFQCPSELSAASRGQQHQHAAAAAAANQRQQAATCSGDEQSQQQLQQSLFYSNLPTPDSVWSIEVPAQARPAAFSTSLHSCELPASAFVKRCHGCQGRGRLKCSSCYGVGYEICLSCSGKGTTKSGAAAGRTWAPAASSHTADHHHSSNYHNSCSYYEGPTSSASAADSTDAGGGGGPFQHSDSRSFNHSSNDNNSASGRNQSSLHPSAGGFSSNCWLTESCSFCHGAGQKRCWICAGRAYNTCVACAGTGQLRCYLRLNITWLNHRDEFVLNNTDELIPRDRLRLCTGLLLWDEAAEPRLRPLRLPPSLLSADQQQTGCGCLSSSSSLPPLPQCCDQPQFISCNQGHEVAPQAADSNHELEYSPPDGAATMHSKGSHQEPQKTRGIQFSQSEVDQLRSISAKMLRKHSNSYRDERMLKQRHKLTQVETFIVSWDWKRRRGHFVVYGDERKVYIAKYPFKSVCNIS